MTRFDRTFRDCLREQAAATGDRYTLDRGYDFRPYDPEPKAPASVRIVIAIICAVGALVVFGPSLVRMVWPS